MRVLIVEDNLQNTLLISRILDHLGVQQYEWKASGWQLFEAAKKMPRVDLVLLGGVGPPQSGATGRGSGGAGTGSVELAGLGRRAAQSRMTSGDAAAAIADFDSALAMMPARRGPWAAGSPGRWGWSRGAAPRGALRIRRG